MTIARPPAKAEAPVWVVVADHSRALLFELESGKAMAPLVEREDLVNAEARMHTRELTSDLPGRIAKGRGGARATVQPAHTARDHSDEVFARRISQRLDAARTSGQLGKLYLIAEAGFLGLLRQQLTKETHKLVASEIAKGVTRMRSEDIRRCLPALP